MLGGAAAEAMFAKGLLLLKRGLGACWLGRCGWRKDGSPCGWLPVLAWKGLWPCCMLGWTWRECPGERKFCGEVGG
jgi:hypothetical protein